MLILLKYFSIVDCFKFTIMRPISNPPFRRPAQPSAISSLANRLRVLMSNIFGLLCISSLQQYIYMAIVRTMSECFRTHLYAHSTSPRPDSVAPKYNRIIWYDIHFGPCKTVVATKNQQHRCGAGHIMSQITLMATRRVLEWIWQRQRKQSLRENQKRGRQSEMASRKWW